MAIDDMNNYAVTMAGNWEHAVGRVSLDTQTADAILRNHDSAVLVPIVRMGLGPENLVGFDLVFPPLMPNDENDNSLDRPQDLM